MKQAKQKSLKQRKRRKHFLGGGKNAIKERILLGKNPTNNFRGKNQNKQP